MIFPPAVLSFVLSFIVKEITYKSLKKVMAHIYYIAWFCYIIL